MINYWHRTIRVRSCNHKQWEVATTSVGPFFARGEAFFNEELKNFLNAKLSNCAAVESLMAFLVLHK
jgi:hypothetical protein